MGQAMGLLNVKWAHGLKFKTSKLVIFWGSIKPVLSQVGLCFLLFYAQEHPKAQPAVVLV